MASLAAGVAGSYAGYLLQRAFLDKPSAERRLKATHTKAARQMRERMQGLRGPAMKLGQTLSLQAGLLPDETLVELASLQMEAPGMHPSLVRAQIKSALGADPDDIFKNFAPEPFAAASLGQVHRAILPEGDVVAVKVQYPGIAQAIESDFRWFRAVSKPAQTSGYIPKAAIDELESQIVAETDYRREADHLDLFRARLAPLEYVEVPRVFRTYSSDRVLTMSMLGGRHLEAWLARGPSSALRDRVGSQLFELFYFQLLKVGALHADPHWGNYLLQDDGRLGLVDFGCVKRFSDAFVDDLRGVFLYPGDRKGPAFQRLLEKRYGLFGLSLRPAARRALVNFAEHFYREVYPPHPERQREPFDFSRPKFIRDYIRESSALLRAKGMLPEYLFLARAEMGLYHTLHKLGARVFTSRLVRKQMT
jgi:predicted unusual protein kinase regulating ubiquinone biosynthesis (AarF/ABC1/UbiB family)